MEEDKQSQERKINKGLSYVVIFITVATVFFLCAQICILEKNMKNLQVQVEEMQIALGTYDREGPESADGAQLPVSDVVEQAPGPGSITVEPPVITPEQIEAEHKVYLTFDDGPSANTEAILDILDSYNVKATFFVLGKEDQQSKDRLQMIYERGHTIGMHSYSHDYSEIYSSMEAFEADYNKIKQYVFDVIGADCTVYRFPGGSSNTIGDIGMQECVDFLTGQGVEYYDWNISSGDGSSQKQSTQAMVKNCTESIPRYSTSIILLHDAASKKETVEALPAIIEAIQAIEGAVILPISEETTAVHHVVAAKETISEEEDTVKEDGETSEE